MKNILVVFVEVTHYNLTRIKTVYETITNVNFQYVYCHRCISGHTVNNDIPSNALILEKSIQNPLPIFNSKAWDMFIINGYTEKTCIQAIAYAKQKKIPYAIETDTQLNVPGNIVKRIIKHCFLHWVFRGDSFGFAGGTRQKANFEYYGMEKERVFLLPMTVDTKAFAAIANQHDKKYYKIKNGFTNKKVISYAGRFAIEKDIMSLLKAVLILREKHLDFCLLLIGKGDQEKTYLSFVAQNKMDEYVKILNYLPTDKLAEYYSLSDVFVLPSIFEPWGLVVNEALACKTPVIASNSVGAADDLILPGTNGDVFESGNIEDLIKLLNKWLYLCNYIEPDFSHSDQWNYDYYKNQLYKALEVIINVQAV